MRTSSASCSCNQKGGRANETRRNRAACGLACSAMPTCSSSSAKSQTAGATRVGLVMLWMWRPAATAMQKAVAPLAPNSLTLPGWKSYEA